MALPFVTCGWLLHNGHLAVIVAMIAVRMVQVTIYQVVDVIAVRDSFMSAVIAMLVICVVTITLMTVGAVRWILCVYLQLVLVNMTFVRRVKMAVVEVVHMVVVFNGSVTAVLAVFVRVVRVNNMFGRHGWIPLQVE